MKNFLGSKMIIAHRGNTVGPNKLLENTPKHLMDAARAGYGIEFDLRETNGELIISHDAIYKKKINATVINTITDAHPLTVLVVNIKQFGISDLVATTIKFL